MRQHVRRDLLLGASIIAALGLLPFFVSSTYYLNVLIMILYFAYLGTTWNILGGLAGQPSLGHAVFVGTGAYTSSVLFAKFGVTPWLGMWVGAVAAALLGWFLGYLSFRYGLRGLYFLMVTIAFAQVFVILANNTSFVGAASGFYVPVRGDDILFFQFSTKQPYYFIILSMLAAALLLFYFLKRSRVGYYWAAIRENEEAAQSLGIDLLRFKIAATILSAFLAALGGSYFAQYFLFISAQSILGLDLSVQIMVYAIVGGAGTVLGPLVGAVLLVPVAEVTRQVLAGGQTGGAHLIAYGLALIIVMMFMPHGVIGALRGLRWPTRQRTVRPRPVVAEMRK